MEWSYLDGIFFICCWHKLGCCMWTEISEVEMEFPWLSLTCGKILLLGEILSSGKHYLFLVKLIVIKLLGYGTTEVLLFSRYIHTIWVLIIIARSQKCDCDDLFIHIAHIQSHIIVVLLDATLYCLFPGLSPLYVVNLDNRTLEHSYS